jgi:hypothetical protein
MQLPPVKNAIRDEENKVTYEVLAYRELSYEELVMAIRVYNGQKRSKKKDRNCTVQIITMIGSAGV